MFGFDVAKIDAMNDRNPTTWTQRREKALAAPARDRPRKATTIAATEPKIASKDAEMPVPFTSFTGSFFHGLGSRRAEPTQSEEHQFDVHPDIDGTQTQQRPMTLLQYLAR